MAGRGIVVECYRSSMVMSRRVLQQILNEQGCKKHKLVDATDEAMDTGVLRP